MAPKLHFRIIDNATGRCVMVMGSEALYRGTPVHGRVEIEATRLMGARVGYPPPELVTMFAEEWPYRLELCR